MRRYLKWMVLVTMATGCASVDSDGLGASAKDAAVAFTDGSFGLVTAGVWHETGSEAADVYVSGDGACAAVLVHFVPDTLSFVVVLANRDHYTIGEVLEAPSRQREYDVEAVTDLVGDHRWVPTFDVPFGGPDVSLEPFRNGTAVFDRWCETVHQD